MTAGTALLIAPDGEAIALTEEMYRVALAAIRKLEVEYDSSEDQTLVTTGQAARILGVSRQTLNRMLDAGEIPYRRNGANHHRRLDLADVLRFRDTSFQSRRDSLDQMRTAASEAGLYDIEDEEIPGTAK